MRRGRKRGKAGAATTEGPPAGNNKDLGARGEALASDLLRRKGYRILEKNFRTPMGEIDIIAEHGRVLVFVEVKTRSGRDFGLPQEAVGRRKQRHLALAAQAYLKQHGRGNSPCRFDVVSIELGKEEEEARIQLLEDAFGSD